MGAARHIIGTILAPLKTCFGCDLVKVATGSNVEGGGSRPGASPDEAAAMTRA